MRKLLDEPSLLSREGRGIVKWMMTAIQGRTRSCPMNYPLNLVNILQTKVLCTAVNSQDENSLSVHLVKLQNFPQILKEKFVVKYLCFIHDDCPIRKATINAPWKRTHLINLWPHFCQIFSPHEVSLKKLFIVISYCLKNRLYLCTMCLLIFIFMTWL